MKGKFIRIISLLTALVMMFSLVACGDNNEDETTTTIPDTSSQNVIQDIQDESNTDISNSEETVTDKKGETVTTKSEKTTNDSTDNNGKDNTTKADSKSTTKNNTTTKVTTTKKKTGAPVNGTVAEIVEFYNNAANASKAKQNFTVTKNELTIISIDSISNIKPNVLDTDLMQRAVRSVGNTLLKNLSGTGETFEEKFVNGKPTIGELAKDNYFPIMGSSKMSTLTASGVKSASCVKDGDGYKVTIVLVPEVGTLTKKPTAHAACTNYLRLEALDIDPFFVSEATMNYKDSTNSGTKIVAKINKNNLLDYMNTYMTIQGSGSGGATILGSELSASAALHGTYKAEYKFIW